MQNYSGEAGLQYHLQIRPGDVGRFVILPGDPKRCAKIAEHFEDARLIADSREYVTYTGYLEGEKVSVTSTGIGGPSASIAMEELVHCGADTFIRVGTCGSIDPTLRLRDMVIVQAAATDSGMNHNRFGIHGILYPPVADFRLLREAVDASERLGYPARVCTTFSSDQFYDENGEEKDKLLLKYGVSCVEMECSELFTLGARFGVQALGILTVSDMIFEKEYCSAKEREQSFTRMMEVALETI